MDDRERRKEEVESGVRKMARVRKNESEAIGTLRPSEPTHLQNSSEMEKGKKSKLRSV